MALGIWLIVGLAKGMNPSLFLQFVHLGKLLFGASRIDAKGSSAILIDERKKGNVARTVRYLDHILKRNTAIFLRNIRVNVDIPNLVDTFIDLKDRPSLRRVINDKANILNGNVVVC